MRVEEKLEKAPTPLLHRPTATPPPPPVSSLAAAALARLQRMVYPLRPGEHRPEAHHLDMSAQHHAGNHVNRATDRPNCNIMALLAGK